jgi:hypothetical protein
MVLRPLMAKDAPVVQRLARSHKVAQREGRRQVRSVKVCAAGGESPPSWAAKLPEFRMKVMNGKV